MADKMTYDIWYFFMLFFIFFTYTASNRYTQCCICISCQGETFMHYSIRIGCMVLLCSSIIRATDAQSEHLTIAHIEAQLTAYQQDPETDNLAQHFDTVYKNRTSQMRHSYAIHPEFNHQTIVHAALIALKNNEYPIIKTPIEPRILPLPPLELNKRLFIQSIDIICLLRHQISNLNYLHQLSENVISVTPSIHACEQEILFNYTNIIRYALHIKHHEGSSALVEHIQDYLKMTDTIENVNLRLTTCN